MEHGGTLHLPTTCVGSASTATLKLTNPSRMAVAYEWDIPAKLEATLMVDLPSGVLRGHESVTLTWQFAPDKDDQYLMKVRPLPPIALHPASPTYHHPVTPHTHPAAHASSLPAAGPLPGLASGREGRRLHLRRRQAAAHLHRRRRHRRIARRAFGVGLWVGAGG